MNKTDLISGYQQLLQLYSSPDKWTKWTWARNEFNEEVRYNDPKAVKWCLSGALSKLELQAVLRSDMHSNPPLLCTSFVEFNDYEQTKFEDMRGYLQERVKKLGGVPSWSCMGYGF